MKKKVSYFVCGRGRLFQRVLAFSKSEFSSFEITQVVSDRECEALNFARKQGIPCGLAPYSEFSNQEDFQRALASVVTQDCDFIILNFNRLIGEPLLSQFEHRIINIHYSLLPSFKGFGAIRKSIASGSRFIGVTSHFVDASVDGGPIVLQAISPRSISQSLEEVEIGQFYKAVAVTIQTLQWLAQGRVKLDGKKCVVIEKNEISFEFSPPLDQSVTAWIQTQKSQR